MSDQAVLRATLEDVDVAIGRRVHQLMWDQKITQTKMGEMLGIDQSTVAKRLRGKLGWTATLLIATAQVLDTSVAYLVGETDGLYPAGPALVEGSHSSV